MRVLIDTNVLISAALSANGTPYQAYVKAASYPNHGLICEQNVDEMKRIFNKKFPNRLAALDKFLSVALLTLELVPVPTEEDMTETQIRDVNDRPILRAAIEAKADVLLTGDKDFLDTVDKSVVLWYNEEKRTGVFLHGEQLSTARYVRCDVGNSQAVHNRKQGNVGRERKGYPSISEWRVLDFENGSTMERPAAGIW